MAWNRENHIGLVKKFITEEQHENTLEARDIHNSTLTSNLAVDDPDIAQKIKQIFRDLTALDNVLYSECLERFPSIQKMQLGYVIVAIVTWKFLNYFLLQATWTQVQRHRNYA